MYMYILLCTFSEVAVPGYDTLSDIECGGGLLETHSDIVSDAACTEKCDDNPVCLVAVYTDTTTCLLKDMCTSVASVSNTVSYMKSRFHTDFEID